jgi:hypothetical protein
MESIGALLEQMVKNPQVPSRGRTDAVAPGFKFAGELRRRRNGRSQTRADREEE